MAMYTCMVEVGSKIGNIEYVTMGRGGLKILGMGGQVSKGVTTPGWEGGGPPPSPPYLTTLKHIIRVLNLCFIEEKIYFAQDT